METITENPSYAGKAIATWASHGNGYLNQEGHRFIWVGWSDEDFSRRLFSTVEGGHVFTGVVLEPGKIHTFYN